MSSSDKADPESQPLVGQATPKSYTETFREEHPEAGSHSSPGTSPKSGGRRLSHSYTVTGAISSIFKEHQKDEGKGVPVVIERLLTHSQDLDSTSYNTSEIGSWKTLLDISGSVWQRKSLWKTAGNVLIVSAIVCLAVILLVKDHGRLQVSKFQKLGTFLNVFVGLLLGFFMSSSMKRWYSCADGFLQIMESIRNLQMELFALGAPEEKIKAVLRYGVLSVQLLNMELHVEALQDPEQKKVAADRVWELMKSGDGADKVYGYMTDEEQVTLNGIEDPAAMIWIWVAQMIGRMAQDGEVPPMPSPTYGRLANLTITAHSGIREVRSSISVQPPYIYVQMLAALVHMNNIINAVSFGLTLGTTLGTLSIYWDITQGQRVRLGECLRDAQSLLVSFGLSVFGPLIYQALLEVTVCIAQPFSSTDGELPARKFLESLVRDLHSGEIMAKKLPSQWQRPYFAPPKPAKA